MSDSKILIVEDDKGLVLAMKLRLMAAGYRVVVAHDAVTGVMCFRREEPDLVVLDLGLPGGDGFRVMESIRNIARVPVIVVTARNAEEVEKKARDLGETIPILYKPVEANDLIRSVQSALMAA